MSANMKIAEELIAGLAEPLDPIGPEYRAAARRIIADDPTAVFTVRASVMTAILDALDEIERLRGALVDVSKAMKAIRLDDPSLHGINVNLIKTTIAKADSVAPPPPSEFSIDISDLYYDET